MVALQGSFLDAQIIDDGPCGIPPPPKPRRIKGGEGVPPLPLPATPLRRSERKRDPAPPVLIGKVVWGKKRVKELDDGRRIPYADWNLDPNDLPHLLREARSRLGIRYRHIPVQFETFSFDPAEIPYLYITGVRAPSFSDKLCEQLRAYLFNGGFIHADACRGSAVFADAMRENFRRILPGRPVRVLPPDHPVFSAFGRVDHVTYSPAVTEIPSGTPFLEGVSIGCRTVAVLSKYGLSCAWDSDHVVPGSKVIVGESAHFLGLNMISYVLATFDLGRFYARDGLKEPFAPVADGDFVFAQLLHEGDAEPDPTGFSNLLKNIMANTSVGLRFSRKRITADAPGLFSYPFLYITGHYDFHLSETAVKNLRRHLLAGGFLLADSCCGRLAFHVAFKREMARVFPDRKLKPLDPEHPVFHALYEVSSPELTPRARASRRFGGLTVPYLEGIEINGTLRVLYSPLDLGNGWEGIPHPYTVGYGQQCALHIGANAVIYALSN